MSATISRRLAENFTKEELTPSFKCDAIVPKRLQSNIDQNCHSTPDLVDEIHWRLAGAKIRYLSDIIGQLIELRNADEEDENGNLQASKFAFEQACALLTDAAIDAAADKREIPRGRAATDDEGGVRIEWKRPGASVRLVVPASANDEDAYVYHEVDDKYTLYYAASGALAKCLKSI